MISDKEILVQLDKWLESDDAKRISDMQTKVTIVKRHDETNTSLRKISLIDAIGRIVLLDYVFANKVNNEYVKDLDSVKKVKSLIRILN
tara:strand:- start:256 stop:522 length:267 start_codon:yes stop_codon:yes gene_type:complete